MKIIEIKGYSFSELSEEAKKKAIEWQQNHNYNDMWAENCETDCIEIGKLMGINIDAIYFSVDGNQGDGACFEGFYNYNVGSVKKVTEHAPLDKELHKIARHLQLVQSTNFYQLHANIKHKGRYYHDKCTEIFIERLDDKGISGSIQTEYALIGVLREFMQWIYKQVQAEYDNEFSDETAIEFLTDNDYLFTVDGEAIKES